MHEYHVHMTIDDCVSVDATSEEEALAIAREIYIENGYDVDSVAEFDVVKGGKI